MIFTAIALLLLAAGLLSACQSPGPAPEPVETPTRTPTVILTGYKTSTPTSTPVPPTAIAVIPVTPSPTPTPFTHVIAKDDSILALAFKYGISREQLEAANPGINPNLLVVGEALIIPIAGDTPTAAPEATPVPVTLAAPVCYSTADGGAWCFVMVENDQETGVENFSAWIGLYSEAGENIASEIALPPLNLLPAGGHLPLVAFFPGPLPERFTPRAELLTALPAGDEQARYLGVELQELETHIIAAERQAEISGKAAILSGEQQLSSLRVTAVAYDESGRVVGVRLWQAEDACRVERAVPTPAAGTGETVSPSPASETPAPEDEPSFLKLPEECQKFHFSVFSLGPEIARVEVIAEARP